MKKYIIGLILLCLPAIGFADQTPTGITKYKDSFGTYFYPYTDFSISTLWGTMTGYSGTVIYNSSGGSSTAAGWVDVRNSKDDIVVQFRVPTFINTGTLTFYIEGCVGTSTGTGTVLATINVTGAGNSIRSVADNVDWLRVGQTITAIGTESVSTVIKR